MNQDKKMLIMGIGNILRKDDGIGIHVVQYLQDNTCLPDTVDVLDGGSAVLGLMPYMMDYDKIVIIDALRYDDKPGSIYRFGSDHLTSKSPHISLHELGIAEVLRILKIQGAEPDVEIIGIVPENTVDCDMSLSPSVAESIPKVVDLILKDVIAH